MADSKAIAAAVADAPPAAELHGVTKVYGEHVKTQVLHGIDLVLRRGEFAALVAPSGFGKSTLLQIMGAPDRPSSGRVRIAGQADRAGAPAFSAKPGSPRPSGIAAAAAGDPNPPPPL